jgi:very-short-patch-repair endonuclease
VNTREAARYLRRVATPAEDRLWSALRRDQLAGLHFRRQHPVGKFIADFYCKAARLAVEVDGPVHHTEAQRIHDRDRDAAFAAAGIRVLRLTNEDVLTNLRPVLTRILTACMTPTPDRVETATQSTADPSAGEEQVQGDPERRRSGHPEHPSPAQRGRGRGRG